MSLVGLGAGTGYYYYAIPWDDRDHLCDAILLSAVCIYVLGEIRKLLVPELGARCPKCQQPWVRDEETGEDWKSWKHCPGCGLRMDDGHDG